MERLLEQTRIRMEKAIAALQRELGRIRTGRASLSILDDIKVEYYGQLLPLNHVATLNVPEPRLITIQPWEANMLPVIEKAILSSSLGLNPSNDGRIIRLPIPPLNEERRAELVKLVGRHGEECKISIRNARHEAIDQIRAWEKEKRYSEDDLFKLKEKVQELTDEYVKKVGEITDRKAEEIMKV